MSFSKNNKFKKMIASFLMVVMLITTFAIVPVSAASGNTVYPGGKIRATVEFAKDIPEGVPCYLFEFEYDGSSLSYSETENHWALYPLTVPHPDWDQPALSCSAFTAVGPEVKAGEKLVSFTFDVTKEINVDELSFSYAEFQLYNNDGVELDSSYFAYSVEVVSQGNVPTEPETEPTTVPVTEPTEPETEPTTVPVTEPTEPETEPTTVPVTEPTEPETEPTTVPVTEPTEPETTVPTEPTPGESKPIIPDEDVNGDNNNGNVNSDANNNNSNVDNDATSTPDTIEPNDNGVIKTGQPHSIIFASMIAFLAAGIALVLSVKKRKHE